MWVFSTSRKLTYQIWYCGFKEIMGSGKLLCISGHYQKVVHKNLSPSENSNFWFFDRFLKFSVIVLENYTAIPEILGSILRAEAYLLMRIRLNFLTPKSFCPRKSENFDFVTVFFWNFLTFLENHPPKSEILGSIEIEGCVSSFCITFLHSFFT